MEKLGAWQQKVVSDAMQGGHDFWSLLAGSKLIVDPGAAGYMYFCSKQQEVHVVQALHTR